MKTLKTVNTNQKNKSTLVRSALKFTTVIALGLITLTSCDPSDDADPVIETPSIDLRADAITFTIDATTEYTGNATITGRVINIGDNFSSGAGQQIVRLYERSLGTPTDQPGDQVASQAFTTLGTGEALTVSFTRPWNASSPAEGEFPPEYILIIDYDPDLLIDSNVHNDDSNTANNRIEKSGMEINDLFR